MQCTCICSLHVNTLKYEGFKRQKKKKKLIQTTEVLQNYIENTLTKKFFSETYDSDNNYIEKDILIITAHSTVSNGPSFTKCIIVISQNSWSE